MNFVPDDPNLVQFIFQDQDRKKLEQLLKPGHSSDSGFLGSEEELLELICTDAEVVKAAGATHYQIAEALLQAISHRNAEAQSQIIRRGNPEALSMLAGRNVEPYHINPNYEFELFSFSFGFQSCPWGCRARGSNDFRLKRKDVQVTEMIAHSLAEGEPLKSPMLEGLAYISELHPHLIGKHYFFEGRWTPYRADPKLLIEALNIGNVELQFEESV